MFKKNYHLHCKSSNQQDYLLGCEEHTNMVFRHTAPSKYKQQLKKTVVCICTNAENIMHCRNPCQKIEESRF